MLTKFYDSFFGFFHLSRIFLSFEEQLLRFTFPITRKGVNSRTLWPNKMNRLNRIIGQLPDVFRIFFNDVYIVYIVSRATSLMQTQSTKTSLVYSLVSISHKCLPFGFVACSSDSPYYTRPGYQLSATCHSQYTSILYRLYHYVYFSSH